MQRHSSAYNDESYVISRRNWKAAFAALRKLMADKHDTEQVFLIMDALNAGEEVRSFQKLTRTMKGGAIAYRRLELADRLMDRAWLDTFAPDTVGGAYRQFLDATGYSAQGLADISKVSAGQVDAEHPYAWMGRRSRDVHDLWHVLTGYKADEHLGEAALVAFSFAQLGGWGWGAIALATWFEALSAGWPSPQSKAIREGYRLGKEAAWLLGEDYEQLLGERIVDARQRLRIGTPHAYFAIPAEIRAASLGQGPAVDGRTELLHTA